MQNNLSYPSVKFITLGCKVNQYETQGMRELLQKQGFNIEKISETQSFDYVVINTCTVTSEADRQNRYWIRRAKRDYPTAKIVVTGCYVEKNRSEIQALPEVDLIVSNFEKDLIGEKLLSGCGVPDLQNVFDEHLEKQWKKRKQTFAPLSISKTEGYGRAFVKIQDGCNHACSFCKVVMVRGRSRSRNLQDVVEEVVRLRDSGYKEIVLAGIQLGAYGIDQKGRPALVEMIEACHKVEGIDRIRLSSIEPTDVHRELIEAMVHLEKCCPHLHIPLQSGDDEILKRMNRRYGRDFYIDLISMIKSVWPDFCLTLDVMAGFAGEGQEHFQNTVDLLKKVKPLKCHVFPYSAREGTRAFNLGGDLTPELIQSRVKHLIALGESLGREVKMSFQNRSMPVLVEKQMSKGGLVQGLTKNYLKVVFQANGTGLGEIASCQLGILQGDVFLGRKASSPHKEFSHV